MEERLISEQGGNEKMAFLLPTSPYFAYYKQRLVQERASLEPVAEGEQNGAQEAPAEPAKPELEKPPSLDWILPVNPHSIPSFDFDLIRLVAQYVAKNGRPFQMGLWNRESRNAQYGFLQPHHPLHDLYQHLVSDYTRIIIKDKPTVERHSKVEGRNAILERITKRKDWKVAEKQSEEEKQAAELAERGTASAIDWNDAIIVDTITFDPSQDHLLPAPIEQGKLLSVYVATKQREEEARNQHRNAEILPNFDSNSGPSLPTASTTPSEAKTAAEIQRSSGPKKMSTICPICRMAFPIDEIEGHMKVEMSKGGSVGMLSANRNQQKSGPDFAPVLATGEDIAARLSKLAKKRTDLFGDDDDDERQQREAEREENAMRERSAAMAAVSHMGSKPSQQQQINPANVMNNFGGAGGSNLNPNFAHRASPMQSNAPSSLPSGAASREKRPASEPIPEEAPTAKKSKVSEVIDLLPEKEWAEQNPGPITLSVVPESEGEPFEVSVPVMTSVKTLKDELASKTSIPVNKQILKIEHLGFLKDKLTMAHYNVTSGTTLQLSTKERGGRKK